MAQGIPEAERVAQALDLYVNGSLNFFNHRTTVDTVSYTHLDVYKRQRPDCVTEVRMGNTVLVVSGYFKKDAAATARCV